MPGVGIQLAVARFTIITIVILRSTQFLEVTVRHSDKDENKGNPAN
jgi:hypothetical protein